jgi:hypothetical protein
MGDRRRRELAQAEEHLATLTAHQAGRESFLAREGWRSERIKAIDDELAHHWAPIVLAGVRADDPLAFGIERLRAARTTYGADLGSLLRSLPPERTDAGERARRQAVSASAGVTKARVTVGGHEILNGDGQRPERWRPRELRGGGHQICLTD